MNLKIFQKCLSISLFCMLGVPHLVLAAPDVKSVPLNLEEIKKEFKKFEKPSLLSGHFEQQKKLKELDVEIKTSGKFRIKRLSAQKVALIWKIEKPDSMMVCIDEQTVVFDNPRLKKKTTLKMSEISQQDSSGLTKMVHLIKMNPETLEQDFIITGGPKKFTVVPKNKGDYQFAQAILELDAQKNLKQVVLHEVNEDSLHIQFTNTKETSMNRMQIMEKACL